MLGIHSSYNYGRVTNYNLGISNNNLFDRDISKMSNDRPGIRINPDDYWKQHWIMNCVAMLHMLPNDTALRFKAMYKLSELANAMMGMEPEEFQGQFSTCEQILRDHNSKLTWWMDREHMHYNYEINPIHN